MTDPDIDPVTEDEKVSRPDAESCGKFIVALPVIETF
jgi:hypothetical protein